MAHSRVETTAHVLFILEMCLSRLGLTDSLPSHTAQAWVVLSTSSRHPADGREPVAGATTAASQGTLMEPELEARRPKVGHMPICHAAHVVCVLPGPKLHTSPATPTTAQHTWGWGWLAL